MIKAAAAVNPTVLPVKAKSSLLRFGRSRQDDWTFRETSPRASSLTLFHYPAMMVAEMQASILDQIASLVSIHRILDPFIGSGTTLTEAMCRGFDFAGYDINPLAVLVSKVKASAFDTEALRSACMQAVQACRSDHGLSIDAKFRGWQKWFRRDVAIALSRIRRAIQLEDNLVSRRFLWVAMAEVARFCSNSRTSTWKLHVRPEHEIRRTLDPIGVFERTTNSNLNTMKQFENALSERKLIKDQCYVGKAEVSIMDARSLSPGGPKVEMIWTSPPYGDNATTVPYGQFSYLPLQWIDLNDIEEGLDRSVLSTTHEIDHRSMGGSRKRALEAEDQLAKHSPALASLLGSLTEAEIEARKRLVSFFRDLDSAFGAALNRLQPGGYVVATVGNRQVRRREVPMDIILRQLLQARGLEFLHEIKRTIPTDRKRMAARNASVETMKHEAVLIMRSN